MIMNEFEVWDPTKGPDVSFKAAPVAFPAYETYKQQAMMAADYIRSLDLSEDNIKQVKKELAKCRKVTDELNKRRLDIKKQVLSEYDVFENRVKYLIAIIDEADSELREKVRELDEMEREAKKQKIREIWDKRIDLYSIRILPDAFDRWLSPRHLNKSTSMKAVEKDMVAWLEKTEKDLETMTFMGEEYKAEYLACLDVSAAVAEVKAREARTEAVRQMTEDTEEEVKHITITGRKDIEFALVLLKANGINFREDN